MNFEVENLQNTLSSYLIKATRRMKISLKHVILLKKFEFNFTHTNNMLKNNIRISILYIIN